MKIRAYMEPQCGWARGVQAVLRKHGLEFEAVDVSADRTLFDEMVRKSGQPLSPCVEIDGIMLADVSGEEVENYLLANDIVNPNEARMEEPGDAGGTEAEDVGMATKTIRFF